jgi:hypothetical protein
VAETRRRGRETGCGLGAAVGRRGAPEVAPPRHAATVQAKQAQFGAEMSSGTAGWGEREGFCFRLLLFASLLPLLRCLCLPFAISLQDLEATTTARNAVFTLDARARAHASSPSEGKENIDIDFESLIRKAAACRDRCTVQ